jgi:hypothetical protein
VHWFFSFYFIFLDLKGDFMTIKPFIKLSMSLFLRTTRICHKNSASWCFLILLSFNISSKKKITEYSSPCLSELVAPGKHSLVVAGHPASPLLADLDHFFIWFKPTNPIHRPPSGWLLLDIQLSDLHPLDPPDVHLFTPVLHPAMAPTEIVLPVQQDWIDVKAKTLFRTVVEELDRLLSNPKAGRSAHFHIRDPARFAVAAKEWAEEFDLGPPPEEFWALRPPMFGEDEVDEHLLRWAPERAWPAEECESRMIEVVQSMR